MNSDLEGTGAPVEGSHSADAKLRLLGKLSSTNGLARLSGAAQSDVL